MQLADISRAVRTGALVALTGALAGALALTVAALRRSGPPCRTSPTRRSSWRRSRRRAGFDSA